MKMTEAQQEESGRTMLRAALDALGEFPGNVDLEDQDETARRVVRALVAAADAEVAEVKRFSELLGERQFLYTEAHEVVATAFWMWSEQVDLTVAEVSPCSVAGARYLGLAQGLAAARAMTEALAMLEDGSMHAFTSRGARYLAPKMPNAPHEGPGAASSRTVPLDAVVGPQANGENDGNVG